jgi:superfamily II DNA or RNA helicase
VILRDYQLDCINAMRNLVAKNDATFLQLPTGAGKTAIVSAIVSMIGAKNPHFVVWFVVPRNELMQQASEHFRKWKIPHGMIAAGREESRAFRVQIVSKDTLLRRLHRIKNWPDVLIFDEAHLYWDAQKLIIAAARARKPSMRVIGQSASPERLDGRGLGVLMVAGENVGGPYDVIHYGPSIPWLTEREFLVPLRYFAPPPPSGFEKLHWRGTEVVGRDYDAYIEGNKRVIYGSVVEYYRKYGRRETPQPGQNPLRPALIFTGSVKSARETSQAFCDAGFNFRPIWGEMPKAERDHAFRAMRCEDIDGLVNCDLATYGVDIPNLEYGASIRFTLSRALYFQKVGRLLRPYPGKREAFFFDQANLIRYHQDPRYPEVPLFFIPDVQWNFTGLAERERNVSAGPPMRFCPFRDNEYCRDPACRGGCKLLPKEEREVEVVDAPLVERAAPRAMAELAPEEKRGVQDRIARAADAYLDALQEEPPRIAQGPVGDLLLLAEELGYQPLWVYRYLSAKIDEVRAGEHKMTVREYRRMDHTVNVSLLFEIARQKGYKKGWIWYKKQEIEEEMEKERETQLVS